MKSIAPVAIWLLSNLAAANAARMSPEDLPRGVNLVSNQIPGAFVVELAAQNGQLGARGVEERSVSPHQSRSSELPLMPPFDPLYAPYSLTTRSTTI